MPVGILPSDGKPITVERMGFLEIYDIPWTVPGPYAYRYAIYYGAEDDKASTVIQEVYYTLADFQRTPEKPLEPEEKAAPGSELAGQWSEWKLYRAVLAHEMKRAEARDAWLVDLAKYIIERKVTATDKKRLRDARDFDEVYKQSLCEEVETEDLEAALARIFQGSVEWHTSVGGVAVG